MSNSKHLISFNVLLRPSDHKKLTLLAEHFHLPKAQVLRQALNAYALMELDHRPVCANGRACLCPHLLPPPHKVSA